MGDEALVEHGGDLRVVLGLADQSLIKIPGAAIAAGVKVAVGVVRKTLKATEGAPPASRTTPSPNGISPGKYAEALAC